MSPSAAASEIRIGTILRETYELTSLLGKGGMGSVFLARHLRLPGKQVAVKVLLHGDELSEEQYARFRREAEIASQLGHPNIVEVLDFHSLEDGTPYMVMEYLRGESLAQRLRKGRLSMREAFSVARQMGSALQAAHRAGVVHRDLKPANVLIVPTDAEGMVTERVKLLDFGISKLMGSQTLQTQDDILMGTPRYMAPEQAMGRNKEIDSRSDLFALGCIVYEMLSGDSPFSGGTIAEVVYRVVHEHPESLATRCPDLPARAVAAVDRALAKSPKDRYADVGTFIAELTGTALQTLSGLGADPTPFPPRGAFRANADPSIQEEESGTDATFVPSRSGIAAVSTPAPQAPAATPEEQSLEKGSTLAAFRAAEQAPAPVPPAAMSVSRRPTDLELAAVKPPAEPPAATPVPAASQPVARSKAPLVAAVIGAVAIIGIGVIVGPRVFAPTHPPEPSDTPPVVATKPPTADPVKTGTEPPPVAPPVVPDTPTVVEAPPPPTLPTNTTAENPAGTPPRPNPTSSRPGKPEKLSEAARKQLQEAERELAAGEWSKAIRIVERTPELEGTQTATFFLGKAYCRARNQSSALRHLNNLKSAVMRTQMRAYCKKHDVELE